MLFICSLILAAALPGVLCVQLMEEDEGVKGMSSELVNLKQAANMQVRARAAGRR